MPTKGKPKVIKKEPTTTEVVKEKVHEVVEAVKAAFAPEPEAPVVTTETWPEAVNEQTFAPVEVSAKKTKYVPAVKEVCLFSDTEGDFVGSIESYDPLVVMKYGVRDDCSYEDVLEVDSLDDFVFSPLTKQEAFRLLAN